MSLTARDIEIISMAMQCLKEPVKVDYAKLMVLGGFKNAASASAVYNSVKKKLEGLGPVNTSAASTNPKKTAPGGKGKPTAAMNGDDDDNDETAADDEAADSNDDASISPTKPAVKKRVSKAKGAAIKAQGTPDNLADEHDAAGTTNGITTPTAKATPKKRAPKKTPTAAIKAEDASPFNDTQLAIASSPTDGTLSLTPPTPAKKRVRKPKDTSGTPAKRAKNTTVDNAERAAAAAAALAIITKNNAELKEIGDTNTFLGNEMGGEHMDHEGYATDAFAYGEGEHGVGDMAYPDGLGFADENAVGEEAMIDTSFEEGLDEDMVMGGPMQMYDGGA